MVRLSEDKRVFFAGVSALAHGSDSALSAPGGSGDAPGAAIASTVEAS